MYCAHCGAGNPQDARFCAGCGRPQAGITATATSATSKSILVILVVVVGGLALIPMLGIVAVGFSLSRTIWVTELLLFAGGAMLVTCFSLTTSLVQLLAPHDLRGRVVSIYMVAFRGGSPLGGLVSGWLATQIGSAPYVLALNGALLTIVALVAMTSNHGLRET